MGGSLLGKEQLELTARLLLSNISSSCDKIPQSVTPQPPHRIPPWMGMELGLGNGDRRPEKELK